MVKTSALQNKRTIQDLLDPFSHCHTMSCVPCGALAKIGRHCLFFLCHLSSNFLCTQTAPIGLFCIWCTAVVAFLGQCTRTIAIRYHYTVSISSQKSTSHASAKQQVGSLALSSQFWQTPSIRPITLVACTCLGSGRVAVRVNV